MRRILGLVVLLIFAVGICGGKAELNKRSISGGVTAMVGGCDYKGDEMYCCVIED
jgi:hypothetical protein